MEPRITVVVIFHKGRVDILHRRLPVGRLLVFLHVKNAGEY